MATVFTMSTIDPSNPQSYDPQHFLMTAVFLLTAAVLVFVFNQVLLPTSDAHRLRWTLASARRDMDAALRGEGRTQSEDESRLFEASRIGTLVGLKDTTPRDIAVALRMADLARAARRIWRGLDEMAAMPGIGPGSPLRTIDSRAKGALAGVDADGLRRTSRALLDAGGEARLPLAADMAWAADLIDAPAEPTMAEPAR